MNYSDAAKVRLKLGIEVLQKYGRDGATIADQLLKDTPADSPKFDKVKFFAEMEKRLERNRNNAAR